MWAAERGYIEIVKLLLEQKGININTKDDYLLLPILISIS